MAKLTEIASPLTGIGNSVTDLLGITDTQAPERAHRRMVSGQSAADEQLDKDLELSFRELSEASRGRDFGTNLGNYNETMAGAIEGTGRAGQIAQDQLDAGNPNNVDKYYNPMADAMLSRTAQAVQGSAGSSLQSSATTKNMSDAVARQAGQLWQDSFNNALADANNNMNVATTVGRAANQEAGLGAQSLDANNQPLTDMLTLANDRAMQRYAAKTGMTMADMELAGQQNTIL